MPKIMRVVNLKDDRIVTEIELTGKLDEEETGKLIDRLNKDGKENHLAFSIVPASA